MFCVHSCQRPFWPVLIDICISQKQSVLVNYLIASIILMNLYTIFLYHLVTPFCFGFIEPPRFVKKLDSSRVVKQHDSSRYECKIGGSPEIKVTWYKDEIVIHPSEKYRMSFVDSVAVIEMHNLSVEDSGDYVCEAQNAAGSASSSTLLKVKGQNAELLFYFSEAHTAF